MLLKCRTAFFVFVAALALARIASAQSNGVTITELSGATQTRPFTISRVFAQGHIRNYPQARIGGAAVATQADVKTRWSDGSVQHALISFVAPIASNGSLAVDFVDQLSANNTGFLDKAAILNFNGGNWGAEIQTTLGTVNVRTMLQNWNGNDSGPSGLGVRYWLKGPIVTQLIVEDRSAALAYDFGSTSHHSLHPIFVVTMYPSYQSGVKVEYIVENMWTTKQQDQAYALTLLSGNPAITNVYSKPSFTHYARTRWRKTFWSGTSLDKSANGGWKIKVDHNLAYMTQSRAIPSFDLTRTSSADGSGYTKNYDINENGQWLKYMPQTGGRGDIGLFPKWYVEYLYSMKPGMLDVLLGNAEVSGYIPFHMRESGSGLFFDSAHTVDAFGRPYSKDAHPQGGGTINVGPSTSGGWTVDVSHQPSFAYIPYLITGDWYFLEELQMWSASNLAGPPPGTDLWWQGHNDWAYFRSETRAIAWMWRTLGHAVFASPDGSPEKMYYADKFRNNMAVREGMHDVRTNFYQTDRAKWDWGYFTASWFQDLPNPTTHRPNPLNLVNIDEYGGTSLMDATKVKYLDAPWMQSYLHIVMGHLEELGLPIVELRKAMAKPLINQLTNPSYNPWLSGAYHMPIWSATTNTWFTDWASMKGGFSTNFVNSDCGGVTMNLQTVTSWPQCNEGDVNDGYPHIVKAAASFLPGLTDGPLTGVAAWNWANSHVTLSPDLRWDIVPRTASGPAPATNVVIR